MDFAFMSESNANTTVHNSEYIRSQRLTALNLIANQASCNTDMDLDMSAPLPNSAQALSDDQLQFVRAQRARDLSPPASNNASPTMELSDMDFTPTESITGAELQHRREQAAIQSSSEQDDDMDIETGIFNHNTYRKHLELDRLRRQREQHFLQLEMSIEESLPPTRKYYSRNSLTDEQDPEFAMLIELDAPNDEWDYHSARMKVLQFRFELCQELKVIVQVSSKSTMPESEQVRLMDQSTASDFVMLSFPTEEYLQMALSRGLLLNGFYMSMKRYIQAREPRGRTLMDYERSRSASLEAEKDESMDALVSGLEAFGVTRNCAEQDVEMG